jgi:hypothetical protein
MAPVEDVLNVHRAHTWIKGITFNTLAFLALLVDLQGDQDLNNAHFVLQDRPARQERRLVLDVMLDSTQVLEHVTLVQQEPTHSQWQQAVLHVPLDTIVRPELHLVHLALLVPLVVMVLEDAHSVLQDPFQTLQRHPPVLYALQDDFKVALQLRNAINAPLD